MRPYINRRCPGIGAAVVVVVLALCLGWPVDGGLAQTDGASNDATLTVGACIGADAASSSLEEALVKEGIIEEGLLQTKVTGGMCKDMLAPVHGGTLAQKLVAAQNYVQEIKLIEGAMNEATDETATRGAVRASSSGESLNLFQTIAFTGEQAPAQAQYHAPEDGGTGAVEPVVYQAAAAAGVGEDPDASIPDRLNQKEAALREQGASAPEAAAGGRCSLEINVADEKLGKNNGLYEISPLMPDKMGQGETKRAGLLVSPVTKERLEEIRREQGVVADASESEVECVHLTHRMKAQLIPIRLDEFVIEPHQSDDVRELSSNRNTLWGWDIKAHKAGELGLQLELSCAFSRNGHEFRLIPTSPIYDGAIEVTPLQSDSSQKEAERPWWRRIFGAISARISSLFGT
ncbi:MAG: hypothetical protein H0U55_07865 [Rubrobacteraceae bacterium]|nr:hypothetical protein [Rubrobacteraceae bacterium]